MMAVEGQISSASCTVTRINDSQKRLSKRRRSKDHLVIFLPTNAHLGRRPKCHSPHPHLRISRNSCCPRGTATSRISSNSSTSSGRTHSRPRGTTAGTPSCTWLLETGTQVRYFCLRRSAGSRLIRGRWVTDALDFLLPLLPSSLLSVRNNAGSTALHWAALNSHLDIAKKLVQFPGGPGVDLIDIKNAAGRSPLGEAENAGWEEGARWFVEVMNLDENAKGEAADEELQPAENVDSVEVEIQDAEGQVAKMTLGSNQSLSGNGPSVHTEKT